jgi:hypothetical protein
LVIGEPFTVAVNSLSADGWKTVVFKLAAEAIGFLFLFQMLADSKRAAHNGALFGLNV